MSLERKSSFLCFTPRSDDVFGFNPICNRVARKDY